MKCGYSKSNNALQFHHTDPNTKSFRLSANMGKGFEKLLAEAKKCVLLCANCHAEEHDESITD